MSLRGTFIIASLLAMTCLLISTQAILGMHFHDTQKSLSHYRLINQINETREHLYAINRDARFHANLIASSGELNRYLKRDGYNLPELATYRALLKTFLAFMKNFSHYREIRYVQPDGMVEIAHSLHRSPSSLETMKEVNSFLQQAKTGGPLFHWYSPEGENGQLTLYVAHAVSTSPSRHKVSGYIVITVELSQLRHIGENEHMTDGHDKNTTSLIRHKGIARLASHDFDARMYEIVRTNPPNSIGGNYVSAQGDYLFESAHADRDIVIEAYFPAQDLLALEIPALIKSSVISLVQILIIGLLFFFFMNHRLIRPLQYAQQLVSKLTLGHWLEAPDIRRTDEIGKLIQAMYAMSNKLFQTTEELDRKRQVAETAEKLKTEFLANVSHEIRTPVNIIIGSINRLEKRLTEPQQKDCLALAKTESKLLLHKIDDIITVADLEAKRHQLRAVDFFLPDIVQRCLLTITPLSAQKHLRLDTDLDERLDTILVGDEQKICKVLVILLENAVKFTENGYVKLSVTHLTSSLDTITFEFSVEDSGCGIESAVLSQLGEAFVQADGAISRRFEGLGLGLKICMGFLHLMGSELVIHSIPGKGSRFSFQIQLPLAIPSTPST